MARTPARGAKEHGDEPRWVNETRGADPLAVYAHTYTAISAAEHRPHRRARARRLATAALFVASAAAVTAVALRSPLRARVVAWLGGELSRLTAATAILPAHSIPTPRGAYVPDVIGTTPARPKAAVRVGDEQGFAVAAAGPELHYSWTVDGNAVGTGPRWTWAPTPTDVGRRRVEVVVSGRDGAERRAWAVRVRPARPPSVIADPPPGTLRLASDRPLRLRVDAPATRPGERVATTWQVDGAPAGDGPTFTLRGDRPGIRTVRAVVRSDLGTTTAREWRVDVAPPEPPTVVAEAKPEREEPEPTPPAPAPREPAVVAAAREPRVPPPAPSAARGEPQEEPRWAARAEPPPIRRAVVRPAERPGREEEVRRWLDRYATAWRTHDVETLRRMGQVTSDREAAALRSYFESVQELDVEVNVIALRSDGDRTTVLFTRRDRFRDPAGRLVLKESPTLEKQIVRTPEGLRFARPTG